MRSTTGISGGAWKSRQSGKPASNNERSLRESLKRKPELALLSVRLLFVEFTIASFFLLRAHSCLMGGRRHLSHSAFYGECWRVKRAHKMFSHSRARSKPNSPYTLLPLPRRATWDPDAWSWNRRPVGIAHRVSAMTIRNFLRSTFKENNQRGCVVLMAVLRALARATRALPPRYP